MLKNNRITSGLPFFLAILSLMGNVALAAEAAPWYQVEVIIFSQQDMFNEEKPRTDIKLAYPKDNWLVLQPAGTTAQGIPLDSRLDLDPAALPETGERPFVMLRSEHQQLGPDHYTLRRTPGYRVLYHAAWRQPGFDESGAPWLLIQGGKQQQDGHFELEGSLRIVKTRFLHVQTNIWKTRFLQAGESGEILWPALPVRPAAGLPSPEYMEADTPAVLTQYEQAGAPDGMVQLAEDTQAGAMANNIQDIFTLKTSEKISPGELAYLDHPTMGLLILVEEYVRPVAAEPTEANEASEAAESVGQDTLLP